MDHRLRDPVELSLGILLIGEAVLPTAIVPLTSIPTFLRGGERYTARVRFDNGRAEEHFAGTGAGDLAGFLARFVTESANPRNRLGVRSVESTCPAPVLPEGLVLIDTPGIGSTFRHNTEATINFLSQCDAALFVVSADPPITEVEVEFLKLVRSKLDRVFFILNKADYLGADERRAAVAFMQQVLCEQAGFTSPPPVFCASARQGLAARQDRDDAAWKDSGMAEIERRIVDFLLSEKAEVLALALRRHAQDILADVMRRLDLTARSLRLPLAELDARLQRFEQGLTELQEQQIVVLHRLAADERRLADAVKEHAGQVLIKGRRFFREVVQDCEDRLGPAWSEDSAREAVAEVMPDFFEAEFGAASRRCEQALRSTLEPCRRRVDELVAHVHRLAEKHFDMPYEPFRQEVVMTESEHPYWWTHQWTAAFGPIPPSWFDRLMPQRIRHARVRRRVLEQVEHLVTRNAGHLQWSTLENLARTVQSLRDSLDGRFRKPIEATRQAVDAARRRLSGDSAAVAPEVMRLQAALEDLQTLRQRLASCSRAERSPETGADRPLPGTGTAP